MINKPIFYLKGKNYEVSSDVKSTLGEFPMKGEWVFVKEVIEQPTVQPHLEIATLLAKVNVLENKVEELLKVYPFVLESYFAKYTER